MKRRPQPPQPGPEQVFCNACKAKLLRSDIAVHDQEAGHIRAVGMFRIRGALMKVDPYVCPGPCFMKPGLSSDNLVPEGNDSA